jgi:D-glycero-D-manno-heptose 1,7-bisphosphate phosphatase
VVDAECAPHWRKPAPGMLQDLARRMHVRVEDICYVGDRDSDRQAAEGAGCRFLAAQAWWH